MAQHQERKIGFKSVQLFKGQTLGIGSYGAVCKAKCDDLLCAAKILHPTLFDPTAQLQVSRKQEHRLPIKRFEQECEFLSTIRHPNIVQYLCMHQDPDTGLPVLLMELMDESLTHFLENSPHPIAYHIQVNVCHDITLALSFLHSNGIVHRDLSGNNVLLRGNILAKVTDFGMAKLGDLNPQATRYTFTMCPGTDVYMPPEAVQDEPVYTEKIDCFSFGVIIVQTLTRQFPKPGNRRQRVEINHPGLPQGTVEVRLAEVNRRQNHIGQVDPDHPLLPIALHCLKDEDSERPSAQQLCERVASLKEKPEYSDSVAAALQQQPQQREIKEKDRQLGQLRQQLQQLQQTSAREREEKERRFEEIERRSLAVHREEIERLTRAKGERERQLIRQFESNEQERAKLEEQLHKLEREVQRWRDEARVLQRYQEASSSPTSKMGDNIKLMWRWGMNPPFHGPRFTDAVVYGDKVYFRKGRWLWAYSIKDNGWTQLPDALYGSPSIAVVAGVLTTIGGYPPTNKLMSLTTNHKWIEKFPPMPTECYFVIAVCTKTDLIVAGGVGVKVLATVEVLNIENRQWTTAASLPDPLQSHSATVCGDRIYMLGGQNEEYRPTKSVYTCSVSALLQTCTQKSYLEECTSTLSLSNNSSSSNGVWSKLPDLPVEYSSSVTFCGQLLAIGGVDSDIKPTTAVYMYNQATNSWNVISHMTMARKQCFAAVLPDNRLMVVGGEIIVDDEYTDTYSVEFGNLC